MRYEPKTKVWKNWICAAVFGVLKRGLKGCFKLDSRVKEEFDGMPEGFSFKVSVLPNGPSMAMKKFEGQPVSINKKEMPSDFDLEIAFKSIEDAFPLVIGAKSVSQAFADGSFIMKGDIGEGMIVARSIDITECYLFPRIMTKRIMKTVHKKERSALRVYAYVIFGR